MSLRNPTSCRKTLLGLQIFSIASLFGVKAQKSSNADRLHEKFHLTELIAQPNAGILTRHGDMLVRSAAFMPASVSSGCVCFECSRYPYAAREQNVELFIQAPLSLLSSDCVCFECFCCHLEGTKGVELFKSVCTLRHDTFAVSKLSRVSLHFSHMEDMSFSVLALHRL